MNFKFWYSVLFGSIWALLLVVNLAYPNFVPLIAVYATFVIWIGGLAVSYLIGDQQISKSVKQN